MGARRPLLFSEEKPETAKAGRRLNAGLISAPEPCANEHLHEADAGGHTLTHSQ